MRTHNVSQVGIDTNNRLTLPRHIFNQISNTLKYEDEDQDVGKAVNLIPIRIACSKGIFLIPYIYYIRHFHRIIAKLPLLFGDKEKLKKFITGDIDKKGRIYLSEFLLEHAGLTGVRDEIASKSGKVVVINALCGWMIWTEHEWGKINSKILFLSLFKKYENRYIKVEEKFCYAGREGGLKEALSSFFFAENSYETDTIILEDFSNTYFFFLTKDLYKKICTREQSWDLMSFSLLDYRCGTPQEFIIKFKNAVKIEIVFKKSNSYLDFLVGNIPNNRLKGNIKAIFQKEGDSYVLHEMLPKV